ncbi:type II secretion system protein [bacterium]|nr:type II secretion system protein [bacterium]
MIRDITKNGFTLAEVLITIGIIGVVAAITIPHLIQENQKRATVTKLQKAISILNQAYRLSFEELGEPSEADLIGLNSKDYFDKYWAPYIKSALYCSDYNVCGYVSKNPYYTDESHQGATMDSVGYVRPIFYTHDGILYILSAESSDIIDNYSWSVTVDLNGKEGPNMYGRDVFAFSRLGDKGIVPAGYNLDNSEVNENCSGIGYKRLCAEKIRRAGWRIEKDYTW